MSAQVASELAQLLSQEQSTVDQLKEILKQESTALTQHDIKAIEQSASVKSRLLKAFSQQVQTRLHYLSTHQLAASESGLLDLLNSLESDPKQTLSQQWAKLKSDFESLQKQNELNGMVIQHSQSRNRSLLNILHGNKNQPNLYNESGASKSQLDPQILGEA